MSLFKKKTKEQDAAAAYLMLRLERVRTDWPSYRKILHEAFARLNDFQFEFNNEVAIRDLTLATVALDLTSLPNIFARDQSERITTWILKLIDSPDWEPEAKIALYEFGAAFKKSVQNPNPNKDLLAPIGDRLLRRWLGESAAALEVKIGDVNTGRLNPIILQIFSTIISTYLGFWKKVGQEFKLVE